MDVLPAAKEYYTMKETIKVTAKEFVFTTPLYAWVYADKDFLMNFTEDFSNEQFDGYNPIKKYETTYRIKQGFKVYGADMYEIEIENVDFCPVVLECARSQLRMVILLYWDMDNQRIMKVGQYPSIASIHIGQIQKYKKVMSKEELKEFTRAIGLAANGVGIGSFVYLRRIFESLIREAADKKINDGDIVQSDFDRAHMDEKIEMLKDVLPEFLVQNKKIYGIISKGIHELSEEECLAMFDILKTSIELVLDEKKEMVEKESKMKTISAQLAQLGGKYRMS